VSVTTDGSPPGPGIGHVSTAPIELTLTTHASLRAVAYRPGWTDSLELSGDFTISYEVGGEVRRLAETLELTLNGERTLEITGNGPFSFPGGIPDGEAFVVTISKQPEDHVCAVLNGQGLVAHARVDTIEVVCRFASHLDHQLFIFMDEADIHELYSRDPRSDDQLPASARYALDGPEVDLRGLRFRGSSSRFLPKKSFNIRFDKRQTSLFNSSRMNLNAMYTDPSMMREALSMELFRLRGRPAPRTRYFDFYLNEIFEGLHIHIERIDSDMVAAWGLNPDGTLVRDEFRDHQDHPLIQEYGRWSAFGFDISQVPIEDRNEFLATAFDSRGSPDWGKLAELMQWVYDTPPGTEFAAGFAERFDEEVFLDWLAVSIVLGEIDGFWDDYWLHLDHNDPESRWTVIPWDKDLTFGSFTRSDWGTANHYFSYESHPWASGGRDNDLVWKVYDTPSLRQRVTDHVQEIMEEWFNLDFYAARTAELGERISLSAGRSAAPGIAFSRHPGNHHGNPAHWELARETLLEFVQLRRQFLQARLWPVFGPGYQALVSTEGLAAGDTVFFTDALGWTMARLTLAQDPETAGTITMQVLPLPGIEGVDRVWQIVSTAGEIRGRMTLYYRNDVIEWLGKENWCTDGAQPVGRQWELAVAYHSGGLMEPVVPSWPNPYANAVTADVTMTGSGINELVLVFTGDPEDSAPAAEPPMDPAREWNLDGLQRLARDSR